MPPVVFPPGTFRPDPRPAAPLRMLQASASLELRILMRNGEQLLLALGIPIAALIALAATTLVPLPEPRINSAIAGVFALAIMSTAFTSQAILTAFDRRYGVLKRLAAAGMARGLLLTGKWVACAAVVVGQLVILGIIAALMGWRPVGNFGWALLIVVLGVAAFLGLGLLLGGTLRAEAVLGLANVLWLVMVVIGGVIVPLASAPGWLATVGGLTPAGALSDGLRDALTSGHAPGWMSLVVLLVWVVAGWAGVVRWFRWQ